MRVLLVVVVWLSCLSSANAENQHIQEAKMMRAAFRCSLWASFADNSSESARLQELGFREGAKYLQAATKDIINLNLNSDIPEVLRARITGVYNKDFEMGRLYEAVYSEANALLLNSTVAVNDSRSAMKATAYSQFNIEDCSNLR